MGETIAILLIFFLFVSFGLIFYTKVMEGGIDRKNMERLELEAIQISQRTSFMAELQCSADNVRKDNCIDLLKLSPASQIIKDNPFVYHDAFGFSEIMIYEIFPADRQWVLYNRTPDIWFNRISTFIPIALMNSTEKSFYFGLMGVNVYQQ